MRSDEITIILGDLQSKVSKTIKELKQFGIIKGLSVEENPNVTSTFVSDQIHQALLNLNPALADMYLQIRSDLMNNTRVSWAGTAHTIREVLVGILRELAPDDAVMEQKGFKLVTGQTKPTQAQKALYILKQRKASSNEQDVVRNVENMDDWIANLVRDSYSRASDAAHRRHQDKIEVQRILKYFEAFVPDLLDIRD